MHALFLVLLFISLQSILVSASINIKDRPPEWGYLAKETEGEIVLEIASSDVGHATLSVKNGGLDMNYTTVKGAIGIYHRDKKLGHIVKVIEEGTGTIYISKEMKMYLILAYTTEACTNYLQSFFAHFIRTNEWNPQTSGFHIAEIEAALPAMTNELFIPETQVSLSVPKFLSSEFILRNTHFTEGASYTFSSKKLKVSLDELPTRRASILLTDRAANLIIESGASVLVIRKGMLVNSVHTSYNFEGVAAEYINIWDEDLVVVLLPRCGYYQRIDIANVMEHFATRPTTELFNTVGDFFRDFCEQKYVGTAVMVKYRKRSTAAVTAKKATEAEAYLSA